MIRRNSVTKMGSDMIQTIVLYHDIHEYVSNITPFIDVIKNLLDDIAPRFKHLLKYREIYDEFQINDSLRKLEIHEVAKLLEVKTGINAKTIEKWLKGRHKPFTKSILADKRKLYWAAVTLALDGDFRIRKNKRTKSLTGRLRVKDKLHAEYFADIVGSNVHEKQINTRQKIKSFFGGCEVKIYLPEFPGGKSDTMTYYMVMCGGPIALLSYAIRQYPKGLLQLNDIRRTILQAAASAEGSISISKDHRGVTHNTLTFFSSYNRDFAETMLILSQREGYSTTLYEHKLLYCRPIKYVNLHDVYEKLLNVDKVIIKKTENGKGMVEVNGITFAVELQEKIRYEVRTSKRKDIFRFYEEIGFIHSEKQRILEDLVKKF